MTELRQIDQSTKHAQQIIMQERRKSSALAIELRLYCTNSSIWKYISASQKLRPRQKIFLARGHWCTRDPFECISIYHMLRTWGHMPRFRSPISHSITVIRGHSLHPTHYIILGEQLLGIRIIITEIIHPSNCAGWGRVSSNLLSEYETTKYKQQ